MILRVVLSSEFAGSTVVWGIHTACAHLSNFHEHNVSWEFKENITKTHHLFMLEDRIPWTQEKTSEVKITMRRLLRQVTKPSFFSKAREGMVPDEYCPTPHIKIEPGKIYKELDFEVRSDFRTNLQIMKNFQELITTLLTVLNRHGAKEKLVS